MDGVDGNQKRRFPSWMLGVAGPDNVKKPGKGALNSDLDDAPVPKVCKTVSKSRDSDTGEVTPRDEKEPDKVTSSSTFKYEPKGKRKRGEEVKVAAPRKRTMRKNLSRPVEESEEISESEDDGELTLDDMMSIANEYVTADKDHQQLSNRDREQESQLQPKAASKNVLRGSSSDPQTNERIQADEKTASTHHSSCDSVSSKVITPGITTTGDTAQDMLNLFLGPLLSQPSEKETKQNFMTEDVSLVSQYGKHSQKSSQDGDAGEEVVVSMKKKSSLKDKISKFLD